MIQSFRASCKSIHYFQYALVVYASVPIDYAFLFLDLSNLMLKSAKSIIINLRSNIKYT